MALIYYGLVAMTFTVRQISGSQQWSFAKFDLRQMNSWMPKRGQTWKPKTDHLSKLLICLTMFSRGFANNTSRIKNPWVRLIYLIHRVRPRRLSFGKLHYVVCESVLYCLLCVLKKFLTMLK